MPTVSVVIPTYNSARYISAAVDSVLEQTYRDLEIIVVDDGSTDNTSEVLASHDSKVRYVHQENAGVSVARNTGIAHSGGRYVAFLDADDTWMPHKLERQVEALQATPDAGGCHTASLLVDDDLRPLGIHRCERSASALEDLLFHGNAVGTPSSVMVERRWLDKVGGFDPELSHSADWDMWIRIAQHSNFVYIDEPLLHYRWHETNMSRNVPLIERDTLQALKKAFSHPETPASLRARAASGIGRQWMVVAGCYFQSRRYSSFARCALQSLRHDPSQITHLIQFPLRLSQRLTKRLVHQR